MGSAPGNRLHGIACSSTTRARCLAKRRDGITGAARTIAFSHAPLGLQMVAAWPRWRHSRSSACGPSMAANRATGISVRPGTGRRVGSFAVHGCTGRCPESPDACTPQDPTDTDTIAALVNSLSTDIMPSRGSYPIAAINKGAQLLEQAGAAVGEVLLITDGSSSPATERIARDLKSSGYTLSVLAVGTTEGAPIPRVSGGFVTDQSGNIAVPKLEERSLRGLATAGGGRFSMLSTDDRDLDYLLSGEAGMQQAGDESLATDHWQEEGPWLVLLLLPLAAMAFRRGWVIVLLLFILPPENQAYASPWDDLWLTRDQQAQGKLEKGAAADAVELFEHSEWRAVAQYRARDYAESAMAFAENEDTRSLYNLGNAMARQGEFESAIDAYEQVLEIDPENEDAEYNRDLLTQVQEQQQSQQNAGDQQEQSDQQGEGEQSEDSGESSQESSDSSAQSDSELQDGDSSQRDEQETSQEDLEALQEELRRAAEEAQQNEQMSQQQLTPEELEALRREQEQEQAMEQWLRRIPNDPGGRAGCCAASSAINTKRRVRIRTATTPGPTTRYNRGRSNRPKHRLHWPGCSVHNK